MISVRLVGTLIVSGCVAQAAPVTPTSGKFASPKTPSVSPIRTPVGDGVTQALLLADNQFSNVEAAHAAWSDNYRADTHVTRVAIRPPHMDHWGQRILEHALEDGRAKKVGLVLHLGDAANISCVSEMHRFTNSMNRAGIPWFMAPGNHDSLMMGNWAYDAATAGERTVWGNECKSLASPAGAKSEAMDKDGFLRAYVAAKGWTEGPATEVDELQCSSVVTNDPRVEARLCRSATGAHWNAYIVQKVVMNDKTSIILLDTTQYRKMPRSIRPGGVTGGIDRDQFVVIRAWLDAEAAQARTVILAGHFPLEALDKPSRAELEDLMKRPSVGAYLSAHTHEATAARFHTLANLSRQALEINVGSILDMPMQYAFLGTSGGPGTFQLTMTVVDVPSVLRGNCETRWGNTKRNQSITAGYYTSYVKAGAYQLLRKQMFEHARTDLVGVNLPEDFQAKELADWALSDIVSEPDVERVADYERCQALWAAEAEDKTGGPFMGTDATPKSKIVQLPIGADASTTWKLPLTH